MVFFNSVDIIIFSLLILAVIIAHSLHRKESLSLSGRYRILLAASIFVILLCDLVPRFGFPPRWSGTYGVRYFFIFTYLLLQPLPVSLGLMYLFSLFRERRFTPGQHLLFLIPLFAGAVAMGYSLFTGFIFSLDGDNVYHRGPGMIVFAVINYSYIIPSAGLLIHYRDIIKRRTLLTVLLYTLIPCLGSFLQLRFYGIITAWPSFTLALLIVYLFLESRRSDRDYLTGLLNRQSFDARIHCRMEQYAKRGPFALIVVDLDKFKSINDQFGHDRGDEVLQAAGRILSQSLSAADTVARYGGDEFVIILETESESIVERVLQRIDHNVDAWNDSGENPFALSLSAGYGIYDPEVHRGFQDLFQQADGAMFESKKGNSKNPSRV